MPNSGAAQQLDLHQAQAHLALQGLEEVAPPKVPVRLYDGPADPQALLAHLGYGSFRPGQLEAVEASLAGRDSMVVMPTGGGKSLCYQLPGLASPDLTIVVSPLIALMADQWKRLSDGGHPAVMLASGLPDEVAREAMAQVQNGEARIVYCSPERFGSSRFWEALESRRVDLFAIDEAHCLAEWGHDFRPDYLRLPRAIERLGRPTVMACTATATEEVSAEIRRRLELRDPVSIRSGFDRPNLSFDIVTLEGEGSKRRKLALLEHGLADPVNRPAIVYCGTRKDTDELAGTLADTGLTVVGYHAGMAPDERASAQHRFMSGDAEVVVATNAFGMGVDKANVRSVWHWAIPTSVEAYYQEAGRAGRDGDPSRAVLLAGKADLSRLVYFNERRAIEPGQVAAYIRRLGAGADDGTLVMEPPRDEALRIQLAIAERAGALSVNPAAGGRIEVSVGGEVHMGFIGRECREASERGWRAFRVVKAFAFSGTCRRRALLDHFGDPTPVAPSGRCCDVCDPDGWLPDPETIPTRAPKRRSKKADAPPSDLSPADESLFESLREWRLVAAAGKPAYTIAHDSTLRAIAAARPGSRTDLERIKGIGPTFLSRHADGLLDVVASAAS